ncbi:MAG TPA: DinB family protein [Anaerolineae bacterium]|nr:DinB family protein [Anaerolineae bacterium]
MHLDALFAHWRQVDADLRVMMGLFGEEDLAYTPFPGSWSVGQILLHIADAEEGWFRFVATREYDQWPGDLRLEEYPNLEAIGALLDGVHARTEAYLATLELADLDRVIDAGTAGRYRLGWIIWHVLEHTIHHRGELSLILGLLGREGLDV